MLNAVEKGESFTSEKIKEAFPPAVRAFTSTLAGNTSDITEEFFNKKELNILRETAEKAISEGKKVIGYGEYGEGDPWREGTDAALAAMSNSDIPHSLAFTLGMAKVRKEEDGTIVIEDRYDWGASQKEVGEISILEGLGHLAKGFRSNGLLGVGNVIGNIMTGGDGGGRKVVIRIPPK